MRGPVSSSLTFTNLHICPQGWSCTGRQADGSMRTFDLSKTDGAKQDKICRLLAELVTDPRAVITDDTEFGLQ